MAGPIQHRAPHKPDLADLQREQKRTNEQLDRRIGGKRPPEIFVHVSPDPPGRRTGRLWLRPRSAEESQE